MKLDTDNILTINFREVQRVEGMFFIKKMEPFDGPFAGWDIILDCECRVNTKFAVLGEDGNILTPKDAIDMDTLICNTCAQECENRSLLFGLST